MHAWAPSDVLAEKYRLIRRLGEGATAEAWEAENVLVGRRVAVKILHPHLSEDASIRSRFLAEARASARIAHPNVVDVFDLGIADGTPFIVMELCDGETLSTIVERRGRMGVSYAADLVAQVLAALHAAHQLGIVHRDLKPDNVMVVHRRPDEPVAKVLDFGIAQGALGDSHQDESGVVFGTAEYMPPEQARGELVDARADLYAAGVMLFELLTGQTPFGGETAVEALTRMLTLPPPRPTSLVRNIPRPLEQLVLRALEKSPANRPQSAREFLGLLAPFTTQRRTPSIVPGRDSEAPLPLVTPGAGAKVPHVESEVEDDGPSSVVHALLTRKKTR